jgi:ribosomal protein L11 methyltransferase
MGCGSGILGLAIKKKWPLSHVISADCDPESVRVTLHNAELNGISDIFCYVSEGFGNQATHQYAPYDVIVANILAKPLCALAPEFAHYSQYGSHIIVSGLLNRHVPLVKETFELHHLILVNSLNRDDWMTLVFKNNAHR